MAGEQSEKGGHPVVSKLESAVAVIRTALCMRCAYLYPLFVGSLFSKALGVSDRSALSYCSAHSPRMRPPSS